MTPFICRSRTMAAAVVVGMVVEAAGTAAGMEEEEADTVVGREADTVADST